ERLGGRWTWHGWTWHGRTWHGRTWHGRTWHGRTWHGRTWPGRTGIGSGPASLAGSRLVSRPGLRGRSGPGWCTASGSLTCSRRLPGGRCSAHMTRTGPGRRVAPSGRLVREATSRGGVLVPAVVGDLDEPWPGRDVGPGPGPGTGRLGGAPPGCPRHLGLECWRGKRRRGRRQPLAPGACGSPVGGPPTCRPAVLPGSLAIFLGLDIFSRLGGCGGPAPHPAHDDA